MLDGVIYQLRLVVTSVLFCLSPQLMVHTVGCVVSAVPTTFFEMMLIGEIARVLLVGRG